MRRINANYAIMRTSADGNCLWNSISNALFGHENFMIFLRLFTYFSFFKYHNYFVNICRNETECLDFYIREALTLGEWGRDINFLALSIILSRKIFVYAKTVPVEPELQLGRSIIEVHSDNYPVLIHFNRNHFETIIPANNNILLEPPQLNWYPPAPSDITFY